MSSTPTRRHLHHAALLIVVALLLSACTGDTPAEDDAAEVNADVAAEVTGADADPSATPEVDPSAEAPSTASPAPDATDGTVAVEPDPIVELAGELVISQPDGSDERAIEDVTVCTFVPSIFMLTGADATMQVSYLTVDYGSRGIDGRLDLDGEEYRVPDYQATTHGLTPDGLQVTGQSRVVGADGTELLARWTLDASEAPPCTQVEALDPAPGEGLDVGQVDTSDLGFVMLDDRRLDVVGGCGQSSGDESTFELELADTEAGAPGAAVFTHRYISGQSGISITDGSGSTYTGDSLEGGPAVVDPGLRFSGSTFVFSDAGQAATTEIDINIAALDSC